MTLNWVGHWVRTYPGIAQTIIALCSGITLVDLEEGGIILWGFERQSFCEVIGRIIRRTAWKILVQIRDLMVKSPFSDSSGISNCSHRDYFWLPVALWQATPGTAWPIYIQTFIIIIIIVLTISDWVWSYHWFTHSLTMGPKRNDKKIKTKPPLCHRVTQI